MNTLYKYMKLEYLKDALYYGVHASSLKKVNDPYEGEGIENPDKYRIVCLTNSHRKMLLWAYYVNHRGCCVEFGIPKSHSEIIKDVNYTKDYPDRSIMNIDEIIESLRNKGSEWEHENEQRAIFYEPRDCESKLWTRKSENVFLKLPVKAVYFGLFAEREIELYIEAIRLILEYNSISERRVELRKMRLSPNRYELIDNNQFDYMEEIKKYSKTERR